MDKRLAELTIEPKLILPFRDALKSLGVQTQLYARLIGAFGTVMRFLLHGAISMSDAELLRLLNKGKTAEALSWAKEVDGSDELRTIHELHNAESLSIIEKLYELGAERVTAIDIESDPDFGETTNMLIVQLPKDAKLRYGLFEYESQHAETLGFDGMCDSGQQYLMLWWT